jgi:hypothetical protein
MALERPPYCSGAQIGGKLLGIIWVLAAATCQAAVFVLFSKSSSIVHREIRLLHFICSWKLEFSR